MLVVEYFSRFIEVKCLNHATTSYDVIEQLKKVFSTHGIPETFLSDNGPQYSSHLFFRFSQEYGFVHNTSGPRYPKSNGEAEKAVQTVKGLFQKSSDPQLALLNYASTPLQSGYSPAELLMGRKIRTIVAVDSKNYCPGWPYLQEFRSRDKELKLRQKRDHDKRHRASNLPLLHTNSSVWIEPDLDQGEVVEQSSFPRSYLVKTPRGIISRNRHSLIPGPDNQSNEKQLSAETDNAEDSQSTSGSYTTRYGRVVKPPDPYTDTW